MYCYLVAGVSDRSYVRPGSTWDFHFFRNGVRAAISFALGHREVTIFFFITKTWPWKTVTYYKNSSKFGGTYPGLWWNVCFIHSLWDYKNRVCHVWRVRCRIHRTFFDERLMCFHGFLAIATLPPTFYPHMADKGPRCFSSYSTLPFPLHCQRRGHSQRPAPVISTGLGGSFHSFCHA